MMKPPFDNLVDENLSHYTAQLGLYQIPIEHLGLKVIGRRLIWLLDDGSYEKIKLDNVTDKLKFALFIKN
jgi:hypothetical protein